MASYDKVLAQNISAARGRLHIDQSEVIKRMRDLGFANWHRQTMGKVERGERGISPAEVIGLAAALETTAKRLMSPLPEDGPVQLATGIALSHHQVRSLLLGHGPNDHDPYSVMRDVRDGRGIRWVDGSLEAGGDDQ